MLVHAEFRAYRRFHRWSSQILEELLVLDTSEFELLQVKNRLLDAIDAAGSYQSAIKYAWLSLPDHLRGAIPNPSRNFSTMPVRSLNEPPHAS
jgi:hypothetical protein